MTHQDNKTSVSMSLHPDKDRSMSFRSREGIGRTPAAEDGFLSYYDEKGLLKYSNRN